MEIKIFDLGLVDYKTAWDFQKNIFNLVKSNCLDSALILCQHYPVITLGRKSDLRNILSSEQELKGRGIEIYETERAGDVTYHGPGQLTVYPIFNLNYLKKDIHWFLRKLEEIIIEILSYFRVKGERIPGFTGVWVGKQKIASIGIAIRDWITFHGLSINIKKNDLENFRLIRPCGMDILMTSLENILERDIELGTFLQTIADLSPFTTIGGRK
jgi:lipoate-protein ligase B